MSLRLLASAILLAAVSAAPMPAVAQQNDATTVQTGGGVNTSTTSQRGRDNAATTAQFGDDNLATIEQRGSRRNKAECGQSGNVNDCAIDQSNRKGK